MNILGPVKSGTIRTVAGNGQPVHRGDGACANSASLNEPKNIAFDAVGNLYIADSENHAIRKVDRLTGVMTTVAGRREACIPSTQPALATASAMDRADEDVFSPLGTTMPDQFTHLADLSGTVRFVVSSMPRSTRFQGDGGPAVHAALNFPSGVAVDDVGHIYIADTMNHRVRKIDAMTGIITTIVGTGQHRFSGDGGPAISAALNEPAAVAIGPGRQLYIADQSNNRVRKVDLLSGLISTVAGIGQAGHSGDGIAASEAALAGPSGLALGYDGTLYIADTFNARIRAIDPDTKIIRTVAGDGGEYRYRQDESDFSTSLSRPYGIVVDPAGDLLITDSDSHLIRKWHRNRTIITRVAGNGIPGFGGDDGRPLDSSLNYPFGVAVDRLGNIYIADTFNHRIRVIAS